MADDYFDVAMRFDAGPAAPAVAEAVNMFRSILNTIHDAKEEMDQMAESTTNFRQSLRDVKALTGPGPVDDKFLQSHMQFMKQTGMTGTTAHDFVEQFLGEAEAFRGRMAPAEFEKLKTKSAQYASVLGGDVTSRAQLAGRLVALGPQGQTAEQALGDLAETERLMQSGSKRADLLTGALMKAGATQLGEGGTGPVGNVRNLAIMTAAASRQVGSERAAATTIEQFSLAVRGFGPEKWQQFVRQDIGIKEGTKVEDAMVPMFQWMEQQQKAGRNLEDALTDQGLQRVEMRRALIGMYNQRGAMAAEFKRPVSERATAATVDTTFAQWKEGAQGREQMADVGYEVAVLEAGKRGEAGRYARKVAATELVQEKIIDPTGKAGAAIEEYVYRGIATDRTQKLIEQRALENTAKRTGVSLEETSTGTDQALALAASLTPVGALLPSPKVKFDRTGMPVVDMSDRVKGLRDYIHYQSGDFDQRIKDMEDRQAIGDTDNQQVRGNSAELRTTVINSANTLKDIAHQKKGPMAVASPPPGNHIGK
jgi:hypothetical protein